MGHVGRNNIYGSWPYVKVSLLLNYLGQAVWLDQIKTSRFYLQDHNLNPFFAMVPAHYRLFMIILAALAAIIASQALISGSFTLVSEATKLKILPRLQVIYPTNSKGQLYIPAINRILWILCSLVVLYFQSSAKMSSAYGLVITITMLMTTILLSFWLHTTKLKPFLADLIIGFFVVIEGIFLLTNSVKFFEGGYVTFTAATLLVVIMVIWRYGKIYQNNNTFSSRLYFYLGL